MHHWADVTKRHLGPYVNACKKNTEPKWNENARYENAKPEKSITAWIQLFSQLGFGDVRKRAFTVTPLIESCSHIIFIIYFLNVHTFLNTKQRELFLLMFNTLSVSTLGGLKNCLIAMGIEPATLTGFAC